MASSLQGQLPFSFDQVKAVKDTIWGPLSAAKSIFESSSKIASTLKDRREKKEATAKNNSTTEQDISQDPDAMPMQDFPRQTTLDRKVTSASDKYRERAFEMMQTAPRPTPVRVLSPVRLRHQPSTHLPPPLPPRDLPARPPPPKKRNRWMLASLILVIAMICTVTPLALLLHHARETCMSKPQTTSQTTTPMTCSISTATATETKTSISWMTVTMFSVVTSTYTFVPPPVSTGIDIGNSAVVIPVTPTASRG